MDNGRQRRKSKYRLGWISLFFFTFVAKVLLPALFHVGTTSKGQDASVAVGFKTSSLSSKETDFVSQSVLPSVDVLVSGRDQQRDAHNRTIFDTASLKERASKLRGQAAELRNRTNSTEGTNKTRKVHFATYASYTWNLTLERIMLQAERSEFFETMRGFQPHDLDNSFARTFREILDKPRGGGYWMWKLPLLEHMLETTPLHETIFWLDAGSTIMRSGKDQWQNWMESLKKSNKDVLRFEYSSGKRYEMDWCVSPMFDAFQLTCDQNQTETWAGCKTRQTWSGLIASNGAAVRELLALVYEALSVDPWIITDVYANESLHANKYFQENRHDQCLFSIAGKILNNHVSVRAPIVDFDRKRSRAVQLSRVKGEEINPHAYAYWKQECIPGNVSKDEFCDELSLYIRLKRTSLLEKKMKSWNRSMSAIWSLS